MPRLEPYADEWIPAVRAFNARIAPVAPQFAMGTAPRAQDECAGRTLRRETLLAVDGDAVRGGIMLQHQRFVAGAELRPVANVQLPVSEGLVDARYASLGMWIIRSALRPHPLAFALGMGGVEQPLPKLLAALGWSVRLVPFLFHVHHAPRFLTRMPLLRSSPASRVVATLAAGSGAGWLGLRTIERWRARGLERGRALESTRERVWGAWADEVWARASGSYSLAAVRDAAALAELYPDEGDRYHCYRISDGGETVGWVVLLRTAMRDSAYFGTQIVGTVLDCLALPGRERDVAATARLLLDGLGADISITNQSHAAWRRAFRAAGYLEGPSNYALATSRALTAAIAATPGWEERMHLTRGDGDGRIHL